ncbi:hypothetical protein MKZ38_009426 [Zalerion maritima]|uniref:Methyltransferase type 11 domain-containing protein n=1 Tax=Zalerion maritima TaxID=339359 RepID=A0AAD5WN65_9PEZI|nr:hypothetical protein MKZ38_009426 [Zalerion maritima]
MSTSVDIGAVPSARGGMLAGLKMASTSRTPDTLGLTSQGQDTEPGLDIKTRVLNYYNSLESRLGYKLVLGGTRHFGYWERDTYWPFPINRALRLMEEKLFERLALPPGGRVLDSGSGDGIVALEMHRMGKYEVTGIDLVPRHLSHSWKRVAKAERGGNIEKGKVKFKYADFHHLLDEVQSGSFDGVYAIETMAHAADVPLVLSNFYQALKPGGRLCIVDYEHIPAPEDMSDNEKLLKKAYDEVIDLGAMPANWSNEEGTIEQWIADVGFENVRVVDYSPNIVPMLRLFFCLAIIPYFIIRFLGIEKYFVNTTAGVWGYRGRKYWRFKVWSAQKPGGPPTENGQSHE